MDKAPDAFRTISEVADELDIPQHVLRFWETRFSQIKPMKRSGGRRFYRPDDVDLLRGIRRLLYGEGYTIRGVQRILKEQGIKSVQILGDTTKAVPSLYALDDGVKTRLPRKSDVAPDDERDDDDDADASLDDDNDDVVPERAVEPVMPPPRRPMATPLPRNDVMPRIEEAHPVDRAPAIDTPARATEPVTAPPRPVPPQRPVHAEPARAPDRRPLDLIRLKAVLNDLVACRQMLDRALEG